VYNVRKKYESRLAVSRQRYCNNKTAYFFEPPCMYIVQYTVYMILIEVAHTVVTLLHVVLWV